MIPPDLDELAMVLWGWSMPRGSALYVLCLTPTADGSREWPRVVARYTDEWDQLYPIGGSTYISAAAWRSGCSKKARYEDVTWITALWADIDPTGDEAGVDAELVRDKLRESALSPTVVDSGRGVQVWQRLTEPQQVVDARQCKLLLQRFGHAVAQIMGHEVDRSVAEPSRIMRAPGTVNKKTNRLASLVCVGEQWETARMRAWLDRWAPMEAPRRPPPPPTEAKMARKHQRALDQLRAHVAGARDYNPTCYEAGLKLAGCDSATLAEAEAVILSLSAAGCGPRNVESLHRGMGVAR